MEEIESSGFKVCYADHTSLAIPPIR
jgi:hypothetical protein